MINCFKTDFSLRGDIHLIVILDTILSAAVPLTLSKRSIHVQTDDIIFLANIQYNLFLRLLDVCFCFSIDGFININFNLVT